MRTQSLLLMEPGRLAWIAEELPEPAPDEALIQTIAGAVSVGAELPQYAGTERGGERRGYPRMTGYESVGRVIALGERTAGLSVGDRVVAFYGHRTRAVMPVAKVLRVPDEAIPDTLALLAILTCDVAKVIRVTTPMPEELVLITGGGAIGLLTLWTLRAYGVQAVDMIEPRPHRRALAPPLGARIVSAPGDPALGSEYAVGFECSSRDAAFAELQSRMRCGGRVGVLADGNVEALTLSPAFHAKELTLIGSSDGWNYQRHAAWYFGRVAGGAPELEAIFEQHVDAPELPRVFARMAGGDMSPVKVFVRYSGADGQNAI